MMPHYSVSQVKAHGHCQERYRLRYLEKIPEARPTRLIRGSAVDHAVTTDMTAKLQTGESLSVEAVEQCAADAAEHGFDSGGVSLTKDESERGLATIRGEVKDGAVNLARLHRTRVAPNVMPATVQEQIIVKLADLPPLVGVIDLVDTDETLIDVKTSASNPRLDLVAKDPQPTHYILAYTAHRGHPPKKVRFDYLIQTKGGPRTPSKIDYIPVEIHRSKEELEGYLERLRRMHDGITKGVFIPVNPDHWVCSPAYCGYFGRECVFTRGMSPK